MCQNGKNIRAALVLISCDIPAARKICGHISALVSCHRCMKRANYEDHQHNFAGMEDMENWFITRDSTEHRRNALAWRSCNSTNSRKNFVSEKGVRNCEVDNEEDLDRRGCFNPERSKEDSRKNESIQNTG
ncbi:hypothetical protein PHYBLDRAFT_102135 [Rhizophagus irregularis DAOM 181602=DAOM 197198]|nr:hypothetical protein PHYBLDRAFT_102135 [Rhizophagus irregularis DAOM 181602=DAOM 197198]